MEVGAEMRRALDAKERLEYLRIKNGVGGSYDRRPPHENHPVSSVTGLLEGRGKGVRKAS